MVDAVDSKSTTSDSVRVQVPWLVPNMYINLTNMVRFFSFHIKKNELKKYDRPKTGRIPAERVQIRYMYDREKVNH